MTTADEPQPKHHRPVEVEGVPAEEHMDMADAAERVELDPEEQPNLADRLHQEAIADADTPEDR
ncbi:hypothetical protein ASG90_14700 [Nocardioides sp. Soil797]|nr:hypothetical protein ASG90_14700 [Nocardioides sp. Soil797]